MTIKWCPNFGILVGLTFNSVYRSDGEDGEQIVFEGERSFVLKHVQDCCESVWLEDVTGDLDDLVGTEILVADERLSDLPPKEEYDESYTWSFYTLRTIKGSVDIRFYGTSNGYYSERADLYEIIN